MMRLRALNVMFVSAALVLASAGTVRAQATAAAPADPLDDLVKKLQDPQQAAAMFTALRALDDKDLAVFYTALANSGNKDWRLFAMGALADAAGKDAAATFNDRLRNDPSMLVRTESLLALIALKLATDDALTTAMNAPDESLQCISARTAIKNDKLKDAAFKVLERLVGSKDDATSAMARMALLGQGRKEHLAPLEAIIKDPRTSPDVLAIMLEQVGEENLPEAASLMEMVIKSDQPWQIKLRAYRSLSTVSDKPPKALIDAIAAGDQTAFRVHLMRVLTARKDAAGEIVQLQKGSGAIPSLAKFEQVRPGGGEAAAAAALEVVKIGHPVLIDYMLDRANTDIKGKESFADLYIPALKQIIQSVSTDPQDIKREHYKAAQAATLLANLATPAAVAELKEMLGGKYSAVTRVVATGLLRCTNQSICDIARPLLSSPYDELSTDAGLLLGKYGDKDAAGVLKGITDSPNKHSVLLVVMADWYRLKIDGRSKAAAEAMAKAVK